MTGQGRARELPESVVVGRVRKPHGVRGEVVVETESDVSGRFDRGSRLVARTRSGKIRRVVIEASRPHGDTRLIRFDGCEDRDSAEELRAAVLEVERAEIPPSPEGAFYYYELVGCRCVDRGSGDLGLVVGIIEDGGGVLLELESSRGVLLLPFVAAYLVSVDVGAGRIEVDLPADLVETCTSTS